MKFLIGIKYGDEIEIIVTNQKNQDFDKFFKEGIIDNGIKDDTALLWIYVKTLEIIIKKEDYIYQKKTWQCGRCCTIGPKQLQLQRTNHPWRSK